MAGRQITIRAGSAAIVRGPRPNVAFWHKADIRGTATFWSLTEQQRTLLDFGPRRLGR